MELTTPRQPEHRGRAHEVVAELRAATGSMALDFFELHLHEDPAPDAEPAVAWGRTTIETAQRFLDLLALIDAAREAETALLARIFRRYPELSPGLRPHYPR
ncbi:hypothetical protein ACIQGZ_23740 [Streptomyces sp. NPDC092296]|uniref:hypothetical protein n=1 Tax=Streptomyces sp. NPDC092296 TaxID=3366012 RepID=UPI0038293638